jgi:hypothetical protein
VRTEDIHPLIAQRRAALNGEGGLRRRLLLLVLAGLLAGAAILAGVAALGLL